MNRHIVSKKNKKNTHFFFSRFSHREDKYTSRTVVTFVVESGAGGFLVMRSFRVLVEREEQIREQEPAV